MFRTFGGSGGRVEGGGDFGRSLHVSRFVDERTHVLHGVLRLYDGRTFRWCPRSSLSTVKRNPPVFYGSCYKTLRRFFCPLLSVPAPRGTRCLGYNNTALCRHGP